MAGKDVTTVVTERDHLSQRGAASDDVLVLCVAYCREEPERTGEIMVVPADGKPSVIGRGCGDGSRRRLGSFRQRGGTVAARPPLTSPGISREQTITVCDGTGIDVENVGQPSMHVNGRPCRTARLSADDVLRIGNELVLLCTRRPPRLHAPRLPGYPLGEFGEPDGAGILGESAAIARLRDAIAIAAAADAHALVLGPTGSGKELVARAIHRLSARSERPLVARNAATLPPGLIDAELFGNIRDYPNTGMPERKGLIGDADGGTLFLDEIGELPQDLQSHLLRVLDANGEYQRLGDSKTRRSHFRLLAATNRNPSSLKTDLLPRLKLRVEVPPLDARREDIMLIARHLVLGARAKAAAIVTPFVYEVRGREEIRFAARFVEELLRHFYPGNVRDLEGVLWRAMSDSTGDTIDTPADRSPSSPSGSAEARAAAPSAAEPTADMIRQALAESGGSVTRAARQLGLTSRYALYRLLRKHGLG